VIRGGGEVDPANVNWIVRHSNEVAPVRVTARDDFFDPAWQHQTVALDETRTVPLTVSGG